MADSVAKRGRPKLRRPPKLSCVVRQNRDTFDGYMCDDTTWQLNVDSDKGLKNHKKRSVVLPKDTKWRTIHGIDLSQEDRLRIIRGEWLSDNIINAAQEILHKKSPQISGLQNVLFSEANREWLPLRFNIDWKGCKHNLSIKRNYLTFRSHLTEKLNIIIELRDKTPFDFMVIEANRKIARIKRQLQQNQEKTNTLIEYFFNVLGMQPLFTNVRFVQVLLDRNSKYNHWICVSNIRTNHFRTVRIYDSDLSRINYSIENYSNYMKDTIKRLFVGESVDIELALVTQCYDRCSGGVYAIAFAQALCAGLDPSDILFTSDAMVMRNHLFSCLEEQRMILFPSATDHKLATYEIKVRQTKKQKHKNKPKN